MNEKLVEKDISTILQENMEKMVDNKKLLSWIFKDDNWHKIKILRVQQKMTKQEAIEIFINETSCTLQKAEEVWNKGKLKIKKRGQIYYACYDDAHESFMYDNVGCGQYDK